MRETSELPTTSLRAPNRHSSFPDLPTSFPYPPTSFPRRRESFLSARVAPGSQRIRRTAWSPRLISLMPINQTEPCPARRILMTPPT